MGRNAHKTTPETKGQVEALAAFGIRQEHIAEMIGTSVATLIRYYRHELDLGLSKANAKVANSLFRKALGEGREAASCAMFWLKTRAGWRETNVLQHEGHGGGAIQTDFVVRFVVPNASKPT
jgi:transposase